MKVKFIKSHPDFGHFVGDEVELNAEAAEVLLNSKHVEAVKHKAETGAAFKGETGVIQEDDTNVKEERHNKKHDKK